MNRGDWMRRHAVTNDRFRAGVVAVLLIPFLAALAVVAVGVA